MKRILLTLLKIFNIFLSCFVCKHDFTTAVKYKKGGRDLFVLKEGLKVRTGPGKDHYLICCLHRDTRLVYLSQELDEQGAEWCYVIMADGHVGWVPAKSVRFSFY